MTAHESERPRGRAIVTLVDELLDAQSAGNAKKLGVIGFVIFRLGKTRWLPIVMAVQDEWLLPICRRRREAAAVAETAIRKIADGMAGFDLHVSNFGAGLSRAARESIADVVSDARRSYLAGEANAYAKPGRAIPQEVFRELDRVRAFWPPRDIADAVARISYEHTLRAQDVFDAWFIQQRTQADDVLVVAELASGRRIYLEDRLDDAIKPLTDAVFLDTVERLGREEPFDDWEVALERFVGELSRTCEQTVMDGMNETMALYTLWTLLGHVVRDHALEGLRMVFPHLSASPDRLADLVAAAKTGAVLLLGKDTDEGLARLKAIQEVLEAKGLACVLLKEQPEVEEAGLVPKFLIYASMTRFVVVENSEPSGHLFELGILKNLEAVTILLQEQGRGASRMPDDSLAKNPLVRVFRYRPSTLPAVIDKACDWAEARLQKNVGINRRAWSSWYDPPAPTVRPSIFGVGLPPPETGLVSKRLRGKLREALPGENIRVAVIAGVPGHDDFKADVPVYPTGTAYVAETMRSLGASILMPPKFRELQPRHGETWLPALALGSPTGRSPYPLLVETMFELNEKGVVPLDSQIRISLLLYLGSNDDPTPLNFEGTARQLIEALSAAHDDKTPG